MAYVVNVDVNTQFIQELNHEYQLDAFFQLSTVRFQGWFLDRLFVVGVLYIDTHSTLFN